VSYFWAEPWFQVSLLMVAAVASVIVVVWYRQDRKEIRERHDALKTHLNDRLDLAIGKIDAALDTSSFDEALGQAEERIKLQMSEQNEINQVELNQHLNDSAVILESLANSAEQMSESLPVLYQQMEAMPGQVKQSLSGLMGKAQQMMNGEEKKINEGLDAMFDDELGKQIIAKYPVIGRRLVKEMQERPQYAPYVRDWAIGKGLLTAETVSATNGQRQIPGKSQSGDISSYYN